MKYLLSLITYLSIFSVSAADVSFHTNLDKLKIKCANLNKSSLVIHLELGRMVSMPNLANKVHLLSGVIELPGESYEIDTIINLGIRNRRDYNMITFKSKLGFNKSISLKYTYGSYRKHNRPIIRGSYNDMAFSSTNKGKITSLICEFE